MDDAHSPRQWSNTPPTPSQASGRNDAAVPSIDDGRDAARDDPADMGTAFGLDLSFGPALELPSDRHRAADEPPRS